MTLETRFPITLVRPLLIVASASAALACTTPHGDGAAAPRWASLVDELAADELGRSRAPSLQLAIAYDGEIVFERAYGLSNVELDTPATLDTRYRTASAAKWMTATAAMQLVESGALDLDEPIQRYCPQFPAKEWTITTRHLLTHTSGIRQGNTYDAQLAAAESDAARAEIQQRRSREALARFTRYTDVLAPLANFQDDPLLFEPGSGWNYSSRGYQVLGCVLAGASGGSYSELMSRTIFDPSGMRATTPDDAWEIVPDRAGLYEVSYPEGTLRRADMRDVSENLPAGGYLSTASDLVAFARSFGLGAYVSAETAALMIRPTLDDREQDAGSNSAPVEVPSGRLYGYGVMLFPGEGGDWIGHSGRQDGASSIVVLSPDSRCAVAVLMNIEQWVGAFAFAESLCQTATPEPSDR